MDFSTERLDGDKIRYLESDCQSSIQILFLPGVFNPEIWKHQFRYFCGSFKTVSYGTESKDYLTQRKILEKVLDRKEGDNTVIVSQGLGNSLAQEMEYREDVVASVMTGARTKARIYPRRPYNFSMATLKREPKLFKKLFFSSITDYRVVRQFLKDVELPEHELYRSFAREHSLRRPVKKSMVIHPEDDRFSSLERARLLKPDASVSMIPDAGTFSFYEKPQDYNKALLDFLGTLEGFVKTRKISRTKDQNRSLKDFVEITN